SSALASDVSRAVPQSIASPAGVSIPCIWDAVIQPSMVQPSVTSPHQSHQGRKLVSGASRLLRTEPAEATGADDRSAWLERLGVGRMVHDSAAARAAQSRATVGLAAVTNRGTGAM